MIAMIDPDLLFDYEEGKLDLREVVELFSALVQSGLAWQLQGSYGRTALSYIKAGVFDAEGNINHARLEQLDD